MNTSRHHLVVPFRFALLLFVHLALLLAFAGQAGASLAQAPPDSTVYPDGIEATGDTTEIRALTAWTKENQHVHPKRAWQVADYALSLARELNDQRGIGESSMVLGTLTSDLDRKEAYYMAAQEAFEQIQDRRRLNAVRRNLGSVYNRRGELERALNTYFDALEEFERLGDTEGQATTLSSIGVAHHRQENLEEAMVYYEQAVALAETLDQPALLARLLQNLGDALAAHGSLTHGESLLRRALAISEEHSLLRYTGGIANDLGFVLNLQGRHEQALPYLLTAERLGREWGSRGLLIAVTDELGKAYMGLGQYNHALRYANESLELVGETGSLTRQMDAHQTLSRIFEATGNHEQALTHYRHYATARDSLFTTEKAQIVTEMQARYETEEQKRANERLEQENRIQALQLTLLLAGVGGLLLILGVLFYRYRLKQKANRLLEELDAAKSRFFANISHEFRTPLTVILGSMQDALGGRFGETTEKLTKQHKAVLRNTRQLQGLIDEVLDLGRLEAGKLELQPAPGDLVRTLRRLVETDAPLAERNGVELTFDHDVEHCPRHYDPEKLEKIVGNLLSNALKFTPKGGLVQVELRCGQEPEIIVSDDGPGIPAEAQSTIFERFEQGEDGSHHGGTGIGLALAKELAELHGGTITLESTPGEGSTFTVQLPLEKATLEHVQGNTPRSFGTPPSRGEFAPQTAPLRGLPAKRGGGVEPSENGSETEPDLSGRSHAEPDRTAVLIIEDNADVRAYVRRSLEETYRVLEAADGEAGLQQARSELPDLIVSDVMLPGIDGYEIARRLKAEPATECIPVVMLTARAAEEDQTEGYGSGAEVYITKPFSPETVRAAIARLLEERLRLRRRLQEGVQHAEETEHTNGHPPFHERARAAVLKHLHDKNFGVEELAVALNVSRQTLYNRFNSDVGHSPDAFARAVRLEHARTLLENGAGSVSEVAYAVGFNSLASFSRAYSTHYGAPPSSHLERT